MNFRIVEGHCDFEEKFTEFVKLYNDRTVTVNEIKRNLHLTNNKYTQIFQEALKEGLIEPRKHSSRRPNPKYYYNTGRGFIVYNKGSGFYKWCRSEEVAREIVALMKSIDWDKSNLDVMAKVDKLANEDRKRYHESKVQS